MFNGSLLFTNLQSLKKKGYFLNLKIRLLSVGPYVVAGLPRYLSIVLAGPGSIDLNLIYIS